MEKNDLTNLVKHANEDNFADFDELAVNLVKNNEAEKVKKLSDGIFNVINSEINGGEEDED